MRVVLICWLTAMLVGGIVCDGIASDRLGRPIFHMRDPSGDDHGDGSLAYPQDKTFHPHEDLLDLIHFQVIEDRYHLHFYFQFGALANPWDAPEGFFHPRIDVFIHNGDDGGRREPLRAGPPVRFASRYPWHHWIRIAPFGGTAVFDWQDDPQSIGQQKGVEVTSTADTATIRVSVDRELLPPISRAWRYYVLVGSFDGFGADGYRSVVPRPSQWLLESRGEDPRVPIVDMLAPAWGPHAQKKQLRIVASNDPVAQLHPVGGFSVYGMPWWIVSIATISSLFLLAWAGRIFLSNNPKRY